MPILDEGPTADDDSDPSSSRGEVLSQVLREHDLFSAQREKRIELLKRIEKHEAKGQAGIKMGCLAFFSTDAAGIESGDIPVIGDALMSLGDVDRLNLIINSPGGDGTVAEKIIELCRAYCKEFKVIVPNRAKSAATVIALGADEIIMGYCSELGPIDAQVPIVVSGIPRYISAQSFIDARNGLESKFKESVKKKEDPRAVLQQIASLDIPFIDHCEKLMEFSQEVARKYLAKYMFSQIKPLDAQRAAVDKVLKGLSSVSIFKVHGRMIDGNAAKTDLKLNVRLLGKDDPVWEDIWQYYVRADVSLSRNQRSLKLIETRNTVFVGASSA
jgi:hypothetical protein